MCLRGKAFQEKTVMKSRERLNQQNRRPFTVIIVIVTLIFSLSLAACTTAEKANAKATTAPNASAAATKSPKTNKLDACALISKAEVEKTLKETITSADSGRLTEGTETTAATSQCSYKTGAAQTVDLFVRRSPVADNTPEAIQRVRDTMKEITQKTPLEVAGIGDAAFWTASRQLHVFAQGNLYFYVSMMNFKDEADAKAKAIELSNQAISTLNQQN
jgi:cytoskeletal protein RodZ